MAYITSEQVKEMRTLIKKAFPAKDGWKWSVTKRDHSQVTASLMQYPAEYDFPDYQQVNHYWLDRASEFGPKETAVLKKVNEILHIGHWDESDAQVDYFCCSHYVSLNIGKWDKPAVKATPKKTTKVTRKAKKPEFSDDEYLAVADFIGIPH